MNPGKGLLKAALTAQLLLAPFMAGAASSPQTVVTTTSNYSERSPQKQVVVLWLQQHAEYVNGHLIGEVEKIGDVTVTYTRAADGRAHPQAPGDAPPTPLRSGQPGDTYSVSHCTAGTAQSWTYKFVSGPDGGGWVLVDYSFKKKACGSDGAG